VELSPQRRCIEASPNLPAPNTRARTAAGRVENRRQIEIGKLHWLGTNDESSPPSGETCAERPPLIACAL